MTAWARHMTASARQRTSGWRVRRLRSAVAEGVTRLGRMLRAGATAVVRRIHARPAAAAATPPAPRTASKPDLGRVARRLSVAVTGLMACTAAVALGLAPASLDVRSLAERFGRRTPVRVVSAVVAVLAGSLGVTSTYYTPRFAVTGAAPQEGLLLEPAPIGHLGNAMDLTTTVPGYDAAAVLLWRWGAWGTFWVPCG